MDEAELADRIRTLLPGWPAVSPDDPLARGPGAYALLIRLDFPLFFERRGIGRTELSGWLVYAGSARGRGGMAARLARHFRRDKPVHWHVDELTLAASRLSALAFPGGSECMIVDALLASGQFGIPAPGLGSSDCRCCPAHLLSAHPPGSSPPPFRRP